MEKGKQTNKLPEGWIWTNVSELFVIIGGGTPTKNNSRYWGGNINWASVKDIKSQYLLTTEDKITTEGVESSSTKIANTGDIVLVTRISPGQVSIVKSNSAINQDLKILKLFGGMNPSFVYFLLLSQNQQFIKNASGTTVKGIKVNNLKNIVLPLPPLQEQHRIVEKIESIFSELGQADKGLQNVKQQLQIYRQAIMKSAFDGKLTNMNVEAENLPEGWSLSNLGNEGKLISGQHILKNNYNLDRNGIPYFTGPSDFGVNYPNITKWTTDPKVLVKRDDILITVKGSGLGKLNIVQEKSTIGRQLMAYNFTSGSKLYMYYFLLSQSQNIQALGIGSAIPGIDRESILSIACPIPPLKEQEQIVEILESRFTLIENLEKSINKCLNDISIFKHSVLKKAFEGKLVNQDANNESAKSLLQRIKKEKENYFEVQKVIDKLIPKKKRQMETKKTVLEILSESEEPISTQELWTNSVHDGDIESFYNEIKEIYSKLTEIKKGTQSLLYLKK
jgi:type I restriction enzyme S subunit